MGSLRRRAGEDRAAGISSTIVIRRRGSRTRTPESPEDLLRQRSSPLVRKIAKENNVDISHLHGSGIAGRVTKQDISGTPGRKGGRGRKGQEDRPAAA
jgi:pyruvate/2-oxoglutarate dehydrogenase complex dihydrolipoamide acyltransferase (E2) component